MILVRLSNCVKMCNVYKWECYFNRKEKKKIIKCFKYFYVLLLNC